uniref:Uncharacterized protein n=1 Tax=Oryza sativa subsp. japonica TaxID=39947 RepID=Q6Z8Q4_ORYSJ|nr:hypothetical protein [Oryza sativa Japonica Group]BAD10046.1 hypothetical protein [Oryza sativa Japonica Group]
MEKKELLGVRKSPPLTKRRRKVTAGGAGGGSMAKAIAAYLASDSFMYAPLAEAGGLAGEVRNQAPSQSRHWGDRAIGAQLRQLAAARAAGRRQVEAAGRHAALRQQQAAAGPDGGDSFAHDNGSTVALLPAKTVSLSAPAAATASLRTRSHTRDNVKAAADYPVYRVQESLLSPAFSSAQLSTLASAGWLAGCCSQRFPFPNAPTGEKPLLKAEFIVTH